MRSEEMIVLICTSLAPTQSMWEWLYSAEAANFAMVVLAILGVITFLVGPYLFRRWKAEKSAEKKSDIAEYGLNNLYTFLDEIKNWIIFGENFVYSKNSYENTQRKEMLPEKEKKEFIESLEKDPLEVNNHCKSGIKIIKMLREIMYRSKRLGDPQLDEKFRDLEQFASKLPNELFKAHFLANTSEAREKSEEYIRNASSKIEIDCSLVHDILINHFNYRKISMFEKIINYFISRKRHKTKQ